MSFIQGINARFLSDKFSDADEAAAALASVQCRTADMKTRRIYTAWDNRRDEAVLFQGLERLVRFGVRPDDIMVYMLIGFWNGESSDDRLYRQRRLREFGCRPYPMPFVRTKELVGFQRWVIGAYDKRIEWGEWEAAGYRPEKLSASSP